MWVPTEWQLLLQPPGDGDPKAGVTTTLITNGWTGTAAKGCAAKKDARAVREHLHYAPCGKRRPSDSLGICKSNSVNF
jgi:hypothetical protein